MQAFRPGGKQRSVVARRQIWGLIFVLPAVLFFAIFFLYPIVTGIYYSMTDFTLLRPPQWVGLENYLDLFTRDRLFKKSLAVTIGFVLGSTIPVWILSLGAALLFAQVFRGREFFKALFFTPLLPSIVVISVVWRVLLNPSGVITAIIGPLVGQSQIPWLYDLTLSPLMSIMVHDWHIIPFYMLIWLAGLMAVPVELREAAIIDGANRLQVLWHVELPLLRPTAVFVAAISTIRAFQGFSIQFVMSPNQGGPVDVNTTLGVVIWKYGFQFFRMGDAAAVSMILFAIIIIFTALQMTVGRSEDFSLK
ncbi:MAG: sugar ABC transporter permease [Chloroflexota bacterium]|nr:sugar ABC transporter permease [Chloroflexota bacterium]